MTLAEINEVIWLSKKICDLGDILKNVKLPQDKDLALEVCKKIRKLHNESKSISI